MAEINDLEIVDANNTARFPEGQVISSYNDGARALEGIVARWHKDTNGSVVSTGSANAYAVSANQTLSAYYDGLVISFDANFENTGSATLNVDAVAAATIKLPNGDELIGGEITAGQKVKVVYDGTDWIMLTPSAVLRGNITLSPGTTLTISSGAVTPTGTYHAIDTEAAAASDDLTTILTTNIAEGGLLLIQPANDARTVVVKNTASPAAGQWSTADGQDYALDDIEDFILFKRRGTIWEEVARSQPLYPAGTLVQTQFASTTTEFSVTTVLPHDNTIPQNTEGDEILTVAITPRFSGSKIVVAVDMGVCGINSDGFSTLAIFKDTDADAVGASLIQQAPSGGLNFSASEVFVLDATDTTARTYKLRAGPSGGTFFVNRTTTTANIYGSGTVQTIMTVTEIAQ